MRPLLDIPKARLVATLEASGLAFADDPSNRDPRFLRARLRSLMPGLAEEGLDARRLALLARRLRRAEAAIEIAVDAAAQAVSMPAATERGPIVLDAEKFNRLPAEVGLRLLGRTIVRCGEDGPVQLAKLEAFYEALAGAAAIGHHRLRRTLAGALVTLTRERLTIEPAPPRTFKTKRDRKGLTTSRYSRPARRQNR